MEIIKLKKINDNHGLVISELKQLPFGLYFVEVQGKSINSTTKLVKQ